MFKVAKKITVGITLLALSAVPTLSGEMSPVGKWQTATGDSRYEVMLCEGGRAICAKLTWLRADTRTADNVRYLNTYVVRGARPAAQNKWRGIINYGDEKVSGSVTLTSPNTMRLQGCKAIFCQSMTFNRV